MGGPLAATADMRSPVQIASSLDAVFTIARATAKHEHLYICSSAARRVFPIVAWTTGAA